MLFPPSSFSPSGDGAFWVNAPLIVTEREGDHRNVTLPLVVCVGSATATLWAFARSSRRR